MGLIDRLAGEPNYDGAEPYVEPPLQQDPNDPNHWTYTSPAPPVLRVKLERGQRGSYGWEISAEGAQPMLVQQQIQAIDAWLREQYGGQS